MNEQIYEMIAKKHRTTVDNVKEEMQKVINAAYEKPNIYAQTVPREKNIPSIDEFVSFVCGRILRG